MRRRKNKHTDISQPHLPEDQVEGKSNLTLQDCYDTAEKIPPILQDQASHTEESFSAIPGGATHTTMSAEEAMENLREIKQGFSPWTKLSIAWWDFKQTKVWGYVGKVGVFIIVFNGIMATAFLAAAAVTGGIDFQFTAPEYKPASIVLPNDFVLVNMEGVGEHCTTTFGDNNMEYVKLIYEGKEITPLQKPAITLYCSN